ncbi:MAG TPA: hypothetical protein VJ694_01390, partial [Patescibacteria group bacterium]|nr:hypothetical protein [Patescibacteria group bacterium]
MSSTFVVTRSFQGGATFATFDRRKCEQGLIAPIRKLLAAAPDDLSGIAVVTCVESGSKHAEESRDGGITPTIACLREAFPAEVASGRIVPVACADWGLNPGSATAINAGLAAAGSSTDVEHALVWSPEIALDGHMLAEMLAHKARHGLRLVGHFRNRWWQRAQWMFAQNTCALWDIDLLRAIGGFEASCNGDGATVVRTIEFGDVPLAGMEDIEAYFRAYRLEDRFVRWGMVGQRRPAAWNLALKLPGTPEYENN